MQVRSNFLSSLDGRIATAARDPVRYGSPEDRREMARLRAWADAVVAGAATIRADDPTLGLFDSRLRVARRRAGRDAEPLRCVLTRSGNLSPALAVFRPREGSRPPVVFAPGGAAKRLRKRLGALAEIVSAPGARSVSPALVLARLARRGVRRVLLEGGGEVHFAFLSADLVDEIRVTLSPVLLGGEDGAPRLTDGGEFDPDSAPRLALVSARRGTSEVFLRYRVAGRARMKRRAVPALGRRRAR